MKQETTTRKRRVANRDKRAISDIDQRDLTKSKRSEEALRQSEANYRAIFDAANDAIFVHDIETGEILDVNRKMCEMYGHTAEEVRQLTVEDLSAGEPPYTDEVAQQLMKKAVEGESQLFEWRAKDKSGRIFWVEVNLQRALIGRKDCLLAVVRDITRRKRAEEKLREQATLLDHARDAILVRDLQDRVVFWNRSAERLYGWTAEEAVGKNVRDLLYQKDSTQFDQARHTLIEIGEWGGELLLVSKDGNDISVDSRWTLVRNEDKEPKAVLVIDTDITEKKKIEKQFLRAQRMESIGILAGGIAHDLNNILSPILMSLEVLKLKYIDQESQVWLKLLQASAERGASMVKQILSFARGSEGKRVILQPKHLLSDVVKILKETFPRSIDVQFDLPSNLWIVTADPTQLHQVLMNLCVNARDAMPNGGSITIRAENCTIDDNYAQVNLEAQAGDFVKITVTDTGTGMDHNVIGLIFEPFFTTKEVGKGTGLGLSTALAIVKSHEGFMNVYSEVGKGTAFTLYLPASSATKEKPLPKRLPDFPTGHGELVLVVDDEDSIRQITKSTLETFGYRVLLAGDGTEALAVYEANRDDVKVVLTDMMMPIMDGEATIRALKRLTPSVNIIAASGLADDAKIAEAARAGVHMFLPKPYTAEQLLRAIAEVLALQP
jgi:two-component system cell cycle sensor histidine kinase/response regulator CckA